MKKLFLYITLFAIVFIIAFTISEDFFENHTKNNSKLTATEEANNSENIPVDAISQDNITEKTNYIVTIKNGYIIVYENSIENIYEYTGIEAETIRVTDEETYNKLNENLIFNTREELFDFLESIAG